MTLRWREEHGEYILESSFPLLGTRGPRIAPSGFEAGLLRGRRWDWETIAAVTWDRGYEGLDSLALCIRGDPWVKELPVVAWRWEISTDASRALLETVRPLVERMGARVENRDEPATHWWHLHPDAKRPPRENPAGELEPTSRRGVTTPTRGRRRLSPPARR